MGCRSRRGCNPRSAAVSGLIKIRLAPVSIKHSTMSGNSRWPKAAACQTMCGNAEGLTSDALSSVSGVKPPLAAMFLFNVKGMIAAAAAGACGGTAVVRSAWIVSSMWADTAGEGGRCAVAAG